LAVNIRISVNILVREILDVSEEMFLVRIHREIHVDARDSQFMTAIYYACENGYQTMADLLLGKRVDLEAADTDGKSPMICAAAAGKYQVTELLLKKELRSKVRVKGNSMPALGSSERPCRSYQSASTEEDAYQRDQCQGSHASPLRYSQFTVCCCGTLISEKGFA
jgi:uncharacterized protein YehS (DUF1456 family)